MSENLKEIFIKQMLLPKEELAMQTMELLADKMDLQSKIDKANQYLEEHFIFDDKNGEYYQTHTFDKDNAKELHNILKEDK